MGFLSALNLGGTKYDLKAANIFQGTREEWNALTQEQQDKYDFVIFKNDEETVDLTDAYLTTDASVSTINLNDYFPVQKTDNSKKKVLWSTIIDKIKSSLGSAALKDSTNEVTEDSTDLVESGAVYSEVNTVKQALTNEAITRSKLGAHNLLPLDLAVIKTNNTSGTWSGSKYTYNNVEFTINTDSDGNITSVNVNTIGTVSSDSMLVLSTKSFGNSNISTYGNISTVNGYTISGGENVSSSVVNLRVAYNKYNTSIYVEAGSTISNKLVYPMIRLASDPNTAYEPYAMTNRELTEDKNKDRNSLVNNITITGYTSSSNRFVCPCDGYVYSSVSVGGYVAVNANSGISFTWGGRTVPDETAYFVQKGMQLQITDNTLPSAVVFRSF